MADMTPADVAALIKGTTPGPDRVWIKWSDKRPPNEPGIFRYRVKAEILGMILEPEWSEKMTLCGMGLANSEWWPLSSCTWDGYRRYITHAGLEWSPQEEGDSETVVWHGLDLLPCPFTGKQPHVKAEGRYIGAPLWHSEALWLSSEGVPSRRFVNAKKMLEIWNTRAAPDLARDWLRLHDEAAALRDEVARLRGDRRLLEINAAAMAEIKAVVDGRSSQSIQSIVYGCVDEISAIRGEGE